MQWTLEVTKSDGTKVDLTGARAYFTVRGLDDVVIIAKANTAGGGSDSQIEIPDQLANAEANKGKLYVKVGTTDSGRAPAPLYADCFVIKGSEIIQVRKRTPFYITPAETLSFPTP
jgi:hypothetical protein